VSVKSKGVIIHDPINNEVGCCLATTGFNVAINCKIGKLAICHKLVIIV